MRTWKVILVILLLAAVGWAFYREWLSLSAQRATPGEGMVTISLVVDTTKIDADWRILTASLTPRGSGD